MTSPAFFVRLAVAANSMVEVAAVEVEVVDARDLKNEANIKPTISQVTLKYINIIGST